MTTPTEQHNYTALLVLLQDVCNEYMPTNDNGYTGYLAERVNTALGLPEAPLPEPVED